MEWKWNYDCIERALDKNREDYERDYIGALRTGNLCFDLVERDCGEYDSPDIKLFCDLYVSGIDTGYGYGNNDIPYDCADFTGGVFELKEYKGKSLEEFKKMIEKECEKSIIEDDKKSKLYSLIEKANEEYNGGFNWK